MSVEMLSDEEFVAQLVEADRLIDEGWVLDTAGDHASARERFDAAEKILDTLDADDVANDAYSRGVVARWQG